ncbi:MAG: iron-containing alcohol dehydrogenase, partial [Rhodoferax sp.]|nr:iron-containing alcohol dehydrogenase [Rhodoferax sp.]
MSRILYITQIEIDFGAVRTLPAECAAHGMQRPLIVTDPGVRDAGVLQRARDALGDLPHAVFDATPSNPTEAGVRAAVEVLRREGCDGLVAVGGGSSIDLAKGVAIAATH